MDAILLLLPCTWKAAVLIALAVSMLRLWPRSSAAERHAAWAVVFVALLALPVVTLLWSLVPPPLGGLISGEGFAWQALAVADGRTVITVIGGDGDEAAALWQRVLSFTAGLWLFGTLAALGLLVAGYLRAALYLHRATRFAPRLPGWDARLPVVSSSDVPVPMTIGVFRPCIALPVSAGAWEPERLRRVLTHEAAHLRRRDPLWKLLAGLVRALYWFHPVVWCAARAFETEREKACDDEVLAGCGAPSRYATDLIEFARNALNRSAAGVIPDAAIPMASPSRLEARIAAILDETNPRQTLRRTNMIIYTLTLVLLLLPLSALQSMAQTAPPDARHTDMHASAHPPRQATPSALPAPVLEAASNAAPTAQPVAAQQETPSRINISGNSQKQKIVKMVKPVYPPEARAEKVQGTVRLKVRIDKEGRVAEVEVESSPDDRLSASAEEAVSQWVYQPTLLNGNPVEVLTVVDVNYALE